MMNKYISLNPAETSVFSPLGLGSNGVPRALVEKIQGSCFGFAMLGVLRMQFPDHAVLQQYPDPVMCSHYLHSLYLANQQNDDAIMKLSGIVENQDPFVTVHVKVLGNSLFLTGIPQISANLLPAIFCVAIPGDVQGHAFYVFPDTDAQRVTIWDSAIPDVFERIESHRFLEHLSEKMGLFFQARCGQPSGEIWLQRICYESEF